MTGTIDTNGFSNMVAGQLITGNGTLGKAGVGTLTLTSSNTYSGGTTIVAGTLRANGSNTTTGSTGSGTVSVMAGAAAYGGGRLGGSGIVKGNVTIASSSTPAAGGMIAAAADDSTIGTLNNSAGNETWNGGGAYEWKISGLGNTATAGSGLSGSPTVSWDQITMNGLTLSSGGSAQPFTIAPHNIATLTTTVGNAYSWIIAQSTTIPTLPTGTIGGLTATSGTMTGNLLTTAPMGGGSSIFALDTNGFASGFTVNGASPGGTFSLEFVNLSGNYDLVLDYTAAPEPVAAVLASLGAVPLLGARRRRRRLISVER